MNTLKMTIAKEHPMIEFETLVAAAQEHGNEEGAVVQIGDLEILFQVAFGLLTEDQQTRFFADPDIVDLLEVYGMDEGQ